MTTAAVTTGTMDYSSAPVKRMRLWPAVVILIAMWLGSRLPGWLMPISMAQMIGYFYGPLIALVLMILWWVTASRLAWSQRLMIPAIVIGGGFLMQTLAHPSMRQIPTVVFALPITLTVWVGVLLVTRRQSWPKRRALLIASILVTWGAFTLLKMPGLQGDLSTTLLWRWSPTAEDRFLASRSATSHTPTTTPTVLSLTNLDWPAFRGPERNGIATGQRIGTDWSSRPPKQLWKHLVGPGWSSFAVIGDRIFTQEQRGQVEAIVCYDAATGSEIWAHDDKTRFDESIAGPGPRATPTFDSGKLYAMGASGLLNCLDPSTGAVIWSRDVKAESGAPLPQWGFSSSPLIAHGIVSVVAGGPGGKAVMAYDAATGKPAWSAGDGWSYASMQPAHLGGVDQILLVTAEGAAAFDPEHGTPLWRHEWTLPTGMNRVLQPTIIGDDGFLISTSFGYGTRRVKLTRDASGHWKDKTAWTSRQVKPYYNDFVLYGDHLYGFDNAIFVCADLSAGNVLWRARGYGNGQVLLLPEQKLLLVLTDTGEVALVEAKPDAHHELAKFQAIEGKTWNHPVVSQGRLFVRNGEEAACYDVGE